MLIPIGFTSCSDDGDEIGPASDTEDGTFYKNYKLSEYRKISE